jgi:hypothetical protein
MGDINLIGIGISFAFGMLSLFIRWRFPSVNKSISNAGIVIAILLFLSIVLGAVIWRPRSPLYSESYPGFQTTYALKIKDAAQLRKQVLFEYETPEKAKAAFYFSATADRFVFSVTDTHGDVQSLNGRVDSLRKT